MTSPSVQMSAYKGLMSRITSLALLLVFVVSAQAHDAPTAAQDPCSAPSVQTDKRPGAGGPPTKVSVGLRMIDLTEINDVKQTMTGDFLVILTWKDPRLVHLEGCNISLNNIWTPRVAFFNSGRLILSEPKEARIGSGGLVKYVQRYYGSLATYHQLHDFPFDDQVFRISLFPLELAENELQLVVDEQVTGRRDLLNISDWTILPVKGTISHRYIDAFDRYHSVYHFEIPAQRITSYYAWKVILPLCLIVAMSWGVFWIDPAKFGPQIGLSATSMLTMIAFIFATTNMLPALGYFTILDLFITASTILIFLAMVVSITTSYLISSERAELATRIDGVCRFVFPLAFVSVVILVFFASNL